MSDRKWKYHKRRDNSIIVMRGDPTTGPHEQWDFYGKEDTARMFVAAEDILHALEAMRTWLGVVADKIDLDPDETRVTISAVSPSGSREVAARSLRQIYEQADAALASAKGEQ